MYQANSRSTRRATWCFETLRDPNSFVRFVDGVSDLKEIDPTHYEAVFETKVAYLKFKFAVTVEVTRIEEPSVIEAKIEGTPLGVVGRLTAKSITTLEEAGDETKVTYSVESTLAGKLGSIGQPVLRSKAKDMEKIFAQRLRAAFAPASPEDPMIPFDLAEPTSLAAAVKLLDPDDATIRPIAGGTALMLMMKAGVFNPGEARQPAQDREQVFEHQRRRRRACASAR